MAAKQPEGVSQGNAGRKGTSSAAVATPPGGFAATLPSRGRVKAQFTVFGLPGRSSENAGMSTSNSSPRLLRMV